MRRKISASTACLACLLLAASSITAQERDEDNGKGCRYGEPIVQRWKVGAIVQASGGPVQGLLITIPVPTDWPEQTVLIDDEDISTNVRSVNYRMVGGGVKQMVLNIPRVNPGEEVRALMIFEVETAPILAPEDTSIFEVERRVPRSLEIYRGNSPFINSRHRDIRRHVDELKDDSLNAWEQIEVFYDWVRDNVEYENGEMIGAVEALRQQRGNGEDLVSLFIALCRAYRVPARTVWVQGHFYAEFYLVDDEGQGHWFPCQVAGNREFGSMSDVRPVLQRGENIRVPEKEDPYRYVPELVKGRRSAGAPRVRFIRELLPAD